MKGKIDKLDFIEMKNICASKDTVIKVKRQHREWEEIFTYYISNQGPVHRIYKELLQLNNKNTTQKMGKSWIDIFPKKM